MVAYVQSMDGSFDAWARAICGASEKTKAANANMPAQRCGQAAGKPQSGINAPYLWPKGN